ncbi:putative von willebrand factor [Alternaria alternata]|nr:putative von willebrand factor [Alternaria alternata]
MPEAEPWQIGIQFFQVGKSKIAQEQLRELDDNVPDMISQYCNGTRIDMEDTVPFTGAENAKLTGDRILISVDGLLVKYKNASKKVLSSLTMHAASGGSVFKPAVSI